MNRISSNFDRIRNAVRRDRLVETALKLIAVPSPTGAAGAVSDCLAQLLQSEGFTVERPVAGHAKAPAVAVRYQTDQSGRVVQFNGHLDTVHLPFVPPKIEGDLLKGSGSSDMKAGIAAAVEALRALRDSKVLKRGGILLTAHDLHESPWGDGSQLDRLIADGYVGDAVLLPEYLHDRLPVIGRGGLIWRATISRPGVPVHEVLRPSQEPSVIAAGAELVGQLTRLRQQLDAKTDALGGSESVFIGQIHSGEIYNQYPQECYLEGTRRWLPGTKRSDVEAELLRLFDEVAKKTGTAIAHRFASMRDAFVLDQNDPFVAAFQGSYETLTGETLPIGAKPFVDDGNSFWANANVPAITHGPRAGGAHTLNEWVSIEDLVRVAQVYALTAIAYCGV